ncbi:MAG TPA: outer membrane beta-barrel protein, partial [Lysobacter sp.]|nr:outer membrane beta-barrel protein [Lysobacter sp.]
AVAKKNFGANNSGFFIAGRAGVAHIEGKISNDVGHGKDSSDKAYFGAGVGYDFSEVFGLSLNYDRYNADAFEASVDADVVTLGAELRF